MLVAQSSLLSPQDFIITIDSFTFQEKYFKWTSYLKELKEQNSQYYQASLEKFVQYYPFNHTYWSQLLSMLLKMPKGKQNTIKMYQVALAKNPRCIVLWKNYLEWLKKQLIRSDPEYLRNQIENASKIVGNHYKAGFVFQYYDQLEPSIHKRFLMLRKAMVSPLEDLDKIKDVLLSLMQSQEFIQAIISIAQAEDMSIPQNMSQQDAKRILLEQLKRRVINLYQPTKQHVQQRQVFEKKITSDQYIPYEDSIENWRQYIAFIKQSGNIEFMPSIYERALINQCDNQALWEEYFLLLENEGNHQRALYLLRFHSQFFRSMSKQLTYYWLEIEQRENPSYARQLYIQLEQNECKNLDKLGDLEIFMRHIQLETRSKEFTNAKAIFDAILTAFTTNLTIVTNTVIEYADFSIRNFRDVPFAKKILQNYLKSFPFSQMLFMGLLEFYEKHVQSKQGTKQAKQLSDEYIEYLLLGLKKAQQANDEKQYKRIKKIACFHMRSFILSIFFIKVAQRKIKEQQIEVKKSLEANGKRQHNGFDDEADGKKRAQEN